MINKSSAIIVFLVATTLAILSLLDLVFAISIFTQLLPFAVILIIIFFPLLYTTIVLYSNSVRFWKKSRFIRKDSIRVTLMGGRGVGKTSLLAAMYEQFDKIPHLNLDFVADIPTSGILSNCLKELQSQISKPETGTLQATGEQREYRFHVRPHGKNPIFDIIFRDFPGEYLEEKQIKEKYKDVANFISDSDVIAIAVDMPALLEDDGKWRETINHCLRMSDLFKHGLTNDSNEIHHKLILFVLTKCEKYIQSGEHDLLLQSIKEKYAGLINHLSHGKEHIAVSVIPIQTLGGVIFDRIQVDDQSPRFFYKQSEMVKGYSPCDTDQPLRQILAFSISLLEKQIDLEPKKISKAFMEDRLTLNTGIKNSVNGFEILQGKNLL